MTTDPVIAAVADEYASVVFFEDEQEERTDPFAHYCHESKQYWRYTDKVLNTYVRGTTDLMRLAQAKVLITDAYVAVRGRATTGHRDKLGSRGHVCLYQVWLTGMNEILSTQMDLDPPSVLKVVMRKPESKPPSSSYALLPPAVFLGEWTEE